MATTVVFFALSMCWIVATPIAAGPDEPAHLIKAAATVRGQLVGGPVKGMSTAMRAMKVPESYALSTLLPQCFEFNPNQRASCEPAWSHSTKQVTTDTYVGRYPPFYYLVVGAPTLATSSVWAVYVMRAISALGCAVLVGLAFALSWAFARSRLMVVGVAVAATPLLVFLSAIVNPSSVEMAAGLCAWVAGLVIVLDHIDAPPRPAVIALAASGSVLVLTRSLSPLWLAAVLGTLFLLDPRGTIALARRAGPVRKALVVLTGVTAFDVVTDVATKSFSVYPAGAPVPAGTSSLTIIRLAFDRTDKYLHQFIGVFGWLDTKSPAVTAVIWSVMLVVVLLIGLVAGTWRQRLCMVLLGIAIVAVPTAITSSHARVDGLVWQARYSYPLDVGLLLLAMGVASRGPLADRRVVRVIAALAAVAIVVAQFGAFYQALRRYVVGLNGPAHFYFNHPGNWQPPLAPIVLLGAVAIALVLYGAFILLASLSPGHDAVTSTPTPPGTDAVGSVDRR